MLWVTIIMAGVVVWAAISAAWAPNATDAGVSAMKLAGSLLAAALLILAAGVLTVGERRRVGWALVVGFTLAMALLAFDLASGAWLSYAVRTLPQQSPPEFTWLKNAATVALLLAWPAALMVRRRGLGRPPHLLPWRSWQPWDRDT